MSVTVPSWEEHTAFVQQTLDTLELLADRLDTVEAHLDAEADRLNDLLERLASLPHPLPTSITPNVTDTHVTDSEAVHFYLNTLAGVTSTEPPEPSPLTLLDCGGPGDVAWLPDLGGPVVRKEGTPIATHGMPWQWERYGPRIEYTWEAYTPGTVHILTAEAWPPNVMSGGRRFTISVGDETLIAHPQEDLAAHVPVQYSLPFHAGTPSVVLQGLPDSIDQAACVYGLRIEGYIDNLRRIT